MTCKLSKNTFLSSLRELVPDFPINPDWVEPVLGFPIINDLARYICKHAEEENFVEVDKGIFFLELGLKSGERYLRDLVSECLESLLACEKIADIIGRFPENILRVWNTVFQNIYEKRRGAGLYPQR